MIDYEKLKKFIQDELRRQKNKDCGEIGSNADCHRIGCVQTLLTFRDFLIELDSPVKPEPKYKVGDIVWIAITKGFYYRIIESVMDQDYGFSYHGDGFGLAEDELYPTKQSLIESQIDFWTSELDLVCKLSAGINQCDHELDGGSGPINLARKYYELFPECQHESDGKLYTRGGLDGRFMIDITSCPENFENNKYKCKKCEGYYL